jgi:hypothetical protein
MTCPNWSITQLAFFAGCLSAWAPQSVRAQHRLPFNPDPLFFVGLVKSLKPHVAEDRWQECIDLTTSMFRQET